MHIFIYMLVCLDFVAAVASETFSPENCWSNTGGVMPKDIQFLGISRNSLTTSHADLVGRE